MALAKPGALATLIGIMLTLFLGAMDETIVATALPRIIADLNGLDRYTWVATAYLLSSTVLVPVYGKLADIMSRKKLQIGALVIFLAGSMLCGLAGEFGTLPVLGDGMSQLIIFRAFQGLGAAGLFSLAFTIVADLFPPAERGRYQGLLGGAFALASVLGPLAGGLLTDHGDAIIRGVAGWRWVFYVNVPVGTIALWFLVARMPALVPTGAKSRQKLDLITSALLILTFVPLVILLQLDHSRFPWLGGRSLLLLGLTVVSFVLFVVRSLRIKNPVLDLQLFRNRVFLFSNLAMFLLGAAFLITLIFLPLFLVNVVGVSATRAGVTLIPLSLGLAAGSVVAGQLVSRYGHYRLLMLIGTVILLAGVFLLSRMTAATPQSRIFVYMILCGIGLGPTLPLYTLAIQNAVQVSRLGQATSMSIFFRQIGGTIGVAIMGAVFAAGLTASLSTVFPAGQAWSANFSTSTEAAQLEANQGPDIAVQINATIDQLYSDVAAAIRAGDYTRLQTVLAASPLPAERSAAIISEARAASPGLAQDVFLAQLRLDFDIETEQLTQTVSSDLKTAFAGSVTRIWSYALYIIILAFFVTFFIPVLPLRKTNASSALAAG
jgi:EmrB/QacA subfamily drug resistance transporter